MQPQPSGPAGANDRSELPHTLHRDDLSALPLGPFSFAATVRSDAPAPTPQTASVFHMPVAHPSWVDGGFKVIARGLGKYIETTGPSPATDNRLLLTGDEHWRDIRFRAVMTPLTFDGAGPGGGVCGIVARYVDAANYVALVLDSDGFVKLLQRRLGQFEVLDAKTLEFCLGQSLTLTLTFNGSQIIGTAGPYAGATNVFGTLSGPTDGGKVGFLSDVHTRFGPFSVECSDAEKSRIEAAVAAEAKQLAARRARVPKMRLLKTVPLHGWVNGRNLRVADINGDGKPEIIIAQGSKKIAADSSMTRLTCLSVLDIDGNLLWQAGVPDLNSPPAVDDLPFQVHDLYGMAVVCVFGYDVQVRDAKTGKVLFSATTPHTEEIGDDYKATTAAFGEQWGDETLNFNVAHLGFCDLQGNGVRQQLFVQDARHHLAVLDIFSETSLQVMFQRRLNHGCYPWIGDLDGDGKDEILAGYSLIDDNGARLWSLARGGYARAAAVIDPLNADGSRKLALIAAGEAGLLWLPMSENVKRAPTFRRSPEETTRLAVAKFRADLPGLQTIALGESGRHTILRIYDATGKKLHSRELPMAEVLALPVNWTGRPEELLLSNMGEGGGLLNGFGDRLVDAPADGPGLWCDTSTAFSTDGRDAILAWDRERLAIYVPDDVVSGEAYKPTRLSRENSSSSRAAVSVPPGWHKL